MYSSKEYQEAANDATEFWRTMQRLIKKQMEKYKIFSQQQLVWKYLLANGFRPIIKIKIKRKKKKIISKITLSLLLLSSTAFCR